MRDRKQKIWGELVGVTVTLAIILTIVFFI